MNRTLIAIVATAALAGCQTPVCGNLAVKDGDKVAFLGASITQFGNADDFGYVNLVVDGLKRAGVTVEKIPAGVSGDRSHMMLARFDRDVAAKKPDWVIVKAGANDITWQRQGKGNELPAFERNLTAICDKADKAGIRVMLVKPTLIGERNHDTDANNAKFRDYCEAIERLAKSRGYLLADAFTAEWKALDALNPKWLPRFTTDNLHLNGRGNILLATEILRAFGADEACLAACRADWESRPSMMMADTLVRNLRKDIPAKEYAALERLAAAKGETVEEHCMKLVRAEADIRGAHDSYEPQLTATIAKKWPIVRTDEWFGGRRTVFTFKGHEAWVVEPCAGAGIAEGRPWTWTMQWATAFVPRTGVPQLLRKGWHHVTLMQFNERMTEEGLRLSKEFQDYLVGDLGFNAKVNLIGMSWGGFFSVRYASTYPELVSKVYLDAPLLSFEKFAHDPGPWKGHEPAGGWWDDPEMPVNRAATIAKAGIPVLLLYGGADTVVDPALNCERFISAYKAAGGEKMRVYKRPGFGHHPHGGETEDTTISDFFSK